MTGGADHAAFLICSIASRSKRFSNSGLAPAMAAAKAARS
jgi:hypothetical protein